MKTHDITKANQYIDKGEVKTIITFRTQQLYDLWENEMSGQISDGMWENSNKTDWLWRNAYVQLGPETKVEVTSIWAVGRKSFGMNKELWDVIGDRIIEENGFKNEKEAKAAWREIATAIYNVTQTKEAREISDRLVEEKRATTRSQYEKVLDEWKALEGIKCSNWDPRSYIYASLDFNKHQKRYLDGTSREGHDYLFLHLHEDRNGNLSHKIEWHDTKFYAEAGKLAETIQAIKDFSAKLLEIAGTPVTTLF